jgi:hypothetical protein
MCLRRAPEKYIAGAALDRAGLDNVLILNISQPYRPQRSVRGQLYFNTMHGRWDCLDGAQPAATSLPTHRTAQTHKHPCLQ